MKNPIINRSCLIAFLFFAFLNNFSQSNFRIFHSWDFENENPGEYTDDEIREDFDVVTLYSHNSASIAEKQLNGQTTKVLKITHKAMTLSAGFDLDARMQQDFDEIYLTYNFQFSTGFNSTTGGKLPGLGGFPCITANRCPGPEQGFLCKSLFKQGGSFTTYHYDHTKGYCPWATEGYIFNPVYFANGVWYNITRRLKMNTFTNGIANSDGIHEVWVDGKMIFRESNLKLTITKSDTLKIDDLNIAHFYGGSSDDCKPLNECYGFIDNIVVYAPLDDPTYGTNHTHSPSLIVNTPCIISDKGFYYDKLVTSECTLHNKEYGVNYSPATDETYLVDAGNGKKVSYTLNWDIGEGDYLLFYDGKTSDSKLIRVVEGIDIQSDHVIKSSGRYLFVRFSTNTDAGTTGFTGTLTFSDIQ